ncbi:Heat shock transcription factor [Heracleum sosnowskyi]|uniref:Heat stress transcription factor n=1 Tax=Heracleum sosnowskyi TaxID=360622 RepID=A0AAD8N763_9APIA|nr:Heat shock transcription factor [Heracleum sosnowskyi]
MEGPHGGSSSPAPFLVKTHDMIQDPVTDSIVSWSPSGRSFVVWNPPEFARDLLPTYFKHNNFSSFVRQLNTYGFRKIDPELWEFANDEFIRGQTHLLPNIHRRKPVHSHSAQPGTLTDSERQEFEEEIAKLKHENNLLQLEFQRDKEESQGFELEAQSLAERLKNIEFRQRNTITFLAQLLQKPGAASSVSQHYAINKKKRRLALSTYLYDEANRNQHMTFEEDNQDSMSKLIEKLDSSLRFWESFVHGVGQSSGIDMYDFGRPMQSSPIAITALHASSGDSDINVQQNSPNFLPSSSDDAESPVISSIYLDLESRPKSPGIDVNARPANVPNIDVPNEQLEETTQSLPTGVNDVFWEQFLTDQTPNGGGGGGGHLTPAERT